MALLVASAMEDDTSVGEHTNGIGWSQVMKTQWQDDDEPLNNKM